MASLQLQLLKWVQNIQNRPLSRFGCVILRIKYSKPAAEPVLVRDTQDLWVEAANTAVSACSIVWRFYVCVRWHVWFSHTVVTPRWAWHTCRCTGEQSSCHVCGCTCRQAASVSACRSVHSAKCVCVRARVCVFVYVVWWWCVCVSVLWVMKKGGGVSKNDQLNSARATAAICTFLYIIWCCA